MTRASRRDSAAWTELNNTLMSENSLLKLHAMLEKEIKGERRATFIERIYGRFQVVRAKEERMALEALRRSKHPEKLPFDSLIVYGSFLQV